jgi:O-acetyl-ADP-ribose deacetylase (regulator of RNase III)
MSIHIVSGDLFANRFGAEALAHGCNCQGSMGAGIAVGFKERYPAMFEEYRRRCKADPREFNLGDCFLWREEGKPAIFDLATQEKYFRARATYDAVETSLRAMRASADAAGIRSIAMPRIGAGLGGLSWKKVRAIIEVVFAEWPGDLYVYETYASEDEVTKP